MSLRGREDWHLLWGLGYVWRRIPTGCNYELNPVTGASTLIGPTGVEVVSGMSLRVLR